MTDDRRCTTTSGAYRCVHPRGHTGPCEAQAPEYALSKPKPKHEPKDEKKTP